MSTTIFVSIFLYFFRRNSAHCELYSVEARLSDDDMFGLKSGGSNRNSAAAFGITTSTSPLAKFRNASSNVEGMDKKVKNGHISMRKTNKMDKFYIGQFSRAVRAYAESTSRRSTMWAADRCRGWYLFQHRYKGYPNSDWLSFEKLLILIHWIINLFLSYRKSMIFVSSLMYFLREIYKD